jgi:AcrR family transcriptional regulator
LSVEGSVRERRRAETISEIKAAALEQLAEAGTGGLSLRGVARGVGMTVQSLYHYFDSRDALLSTLVTDGHHALADAVESAAAASRGRSAADRLVIVAGAFREWARANTPAFLLLYGTPVPGFDPGPASDSGRAALRLATPFLEVVFEGWTADELAAIEVPGGVVPAVDAGGIPLPIGALVLFVGLRAHMHGLVMLELLEHLHPFVGDAGTMFTAEMRRCAGQVAALRAAL